ncbi:rCG46325 [Rattus norvegicus]|uniref:RCG46325 n=1 Tax=Rattus norvegicus TaxID=10116 RepID=A6IDJ9_RAT|nr:rCG46325 [Rattus norvegicus]
MFISLSLMIIFLCRTNKVHLVVMF